MRAIRRPHCNLHHLVSGRVLRGRGRSESLKATESDFEVPACVRVEGLPPYLLRRAANDSETVRCRRGRARALPKLPSGFGGKTGPSRGCVKPGRGLKVSCAIARRLRLGLRLFNPYRNKTIRLRGFWYLKPGRRVGAWHAIWRILPKTLRRETV